MFQAVRGRTASVYVMRDFDLRQFRRRFPEHLSKNTSEVRLKKNRKEQTGMSSMIKQERKNDMTREKYESLPLATLKELAKARNMRGISTLKRGN